MSINGRTNEQTVDDCLDLARRVLSMLGCFVLKGHRFDKATHPQERMAWRIAVAAYEHIEGTDVNEALRQLEDEQGEGE